MMRLKAMFMLGACLLVAGCSDIFGPGSEASRLASARQRWRSNGPGEYVYTFQRSCFCVETDAIRVLVSNNVVLSATNMRTGRAVDVRFVDTVESLFAFIENGLDRGAAQLEVTYDSRLGYPREIIYDGSRGVADDEATITASALEQAPATPRAVRE